MQACTSAIVREMRWSCDQGLCITTLEASSKAAARSWAYCVQSEHDLQHMCQRVMHECEEDRSTYLKRLDMVTVPLHVLGACGAVAIRVSAARVHKRGIRSQVLVSLTWIGLCAEPLLSTV